MLSHRNLCRENLSWPAREPTVCPIETLVRSCEYCQTHEFEELLSRVLCGVPTIQHEQFGQCSKPVPGPRHTIGRTRRINVAAQMHTTVFGVWRFVGVGGRSRDNHGCRQELSNGGRRLCRTNPSAHCATSHQIAKRHEREKAIAAAAINVADTILRHHYNVLPQQASIIAS